MKLTWIDGDGDVVEGGRSRSRVVCTFRTFNRVVGQASKAMESLGKERPVRWE